MSFVESIALSVLQIHLDQTVLCTRSHYRWSMMLDNTWHYSRIKALLLLGLFLHSLLMVLNRSLHANEKVSIHFCCYLWNSMSYMESHSTHGQQGLHCSALREMILCLSLHSGRIQNEWMACLSVWSLMWFYNALNVIESEVFSSCLCIKILHMCQLIEKVSVGCWSGCVVLQHQSFESHNNSNVRKSSFVCLDILQRNNRLSQNSEWRVYNESLWNVLLDRWNDHWCMQSNNRWVRLQ